MVSKTLVFATNTVDARRKLDKAVVRLGAKNLSVIEHRGNGDFQVTITFMYKDQKYEFRFSRSTAKYKGIEIGQDKDVFVAVAYGISQLALLAERGIFDFGQLVVGFKQLEFIETPAWAIFMGFNSRPRNYLECEGRFKELAKGAMSPDRNPDDFRKLNEIRAIYRQYFKVNPAGGKNE